MNSEKFQSVLRKKKEMDLEQSLKKKIGQIAKEIAFAQQMENREVQRLVDRKNEQCAKWLRTVAMCILCERVKARMEEKWESVKNSMFAAFQVKKIIKRTSRRMSILKGYTIYERSLVDSKK